MVHTPVSMPESAFCRSCGYDLHGLDEPRCPECGRAFDPHDPRSYNRSRTAERRLRNLIAMYVGPLAISFLFGMLMNGALTAPLYMRLRLCAYAACGPIGLFVHGTHVTTTVWITFALVWIVWLCVVARTRWLRRLPYALHFLLGGIDQPCPSSASCSSGSWGVQMTPNPTRCPEAQVS